MDDEWEEETTYVAFDLGRNVTEDFVDTVSRSDGGCRIIGIEEGEPYLQLGELIFEGKVDESIGTHLFFEIEERKAEPGLLSLLTSIRSDGEEANKPQRYTTTFKFSTDTIVMMEPVTLQAKVKAEGQQKEVQKKEEEMIDSDDSDELMIL